MPRCANGKHGAAITTYIFLRIKLKLLARNYMGAYFFIRNNHKHLQYKHLW